MSTTDTMPWEFQKIGEIYLPEQPGVTSPASARGAQRTFNYAKGPIAVDSVRQRLFVRGHQKYNDVAELAIPELGMLATVTRWFDPTEGQLDAFNAAYKLQNPGSQGIFHRGFCYMDDGLYGMVQPFYNVTNTWLKAHWYSKCLSGTFQGFGKTSVSSLMAAGWIGPLSARARMLSGKDTFCFESVPQGVANTNNGPGCYLFNRSPRIADGQTVELQPVLETPFQHPFQDWWGDREITGACFTPTHFICAYTKSFGARWYGNNSIGHVYGDKSGCPAYTIPSQLHPGSPAVDPRDNSAQGFHAEGFGSFLLATTIESLLAGTPDWGEVDLRPTGVTSTWGQLAITYDPATGRVYGLERGGNGVKPRIHVFQTFSEADMQAIDDMRAQLSALEAQFNQQATDLANAQQQVVAVQAQVDAANAAAAAAAADRDGYKGLLDKIVADLAPVIPAPTPTA